MFGLIALTPFVPDQGSVPRPTPRYEPTLELAGFADANADATAGGQPRLRLVYKRNNPRGLVEIRLAKHPGGRPALVDDAGKPVRRNLTFTANNPALGRIKVYATPLKTGPFFTQWIKTPKGTPLGYLQISGSRLTATEIRRAVEAVRYSPPAPASGPVPLDPERKREVPPLD